MLRELAELTVIDEANPQSFRVRAYESAVQAIAGQSSDLAQLSARELQKIEGIGKSTAEKIRELLDTGRVAKLEALRQKHPPGVVALTRIPGLGPKALGRLRSELGVASIDDLRRALAAHALRELKGFGAKSEAKLAEALARMDVHGSVERTPIHVALPLATRITERLREVPLAFTRHPSIARDVTNVTRTRSTRRCATGADVKPRPRARRFRDCLPDASLPAG